MSNSEEVPRLTLLPDSLTLIRILKSDVDICSKQLIRLAFFNSSKTSFFSYTETETEVSLILDKESTEQFSSLIDELQLQTQHWRAIEIFEGPQALDETGLICKYSEPLARHHLDLIYVSTYHTDLILVEEDNVERAVSSLQQVALENNARSPSPSPQQQLGSTDTLPRFTSQDDVEALQDESTFETTHILAKLDTSLHLVNFAETHVPALTHALLQIFLFPREQSRFFSYTAYGGQVTLILDSVDFDVLQPHFETIVHHEDLWNVIHIQASAAGIDSSVLNFAARVLAQNHISIYYLSTLNDDFILIPQDSSNKALECLQARPAENSV